MNNFTASPLVSILCDAMRIAMETPTTECRSRPGATDNIYRAASERIELIKAAYTQVQPTISPLKQIAHASRSLDDVYHTVLADFQLYSPARMFCGDRSSAPYNKEYPTAALCIRGLLPLVHRGGHLLDVALCSLLTLYLSRVRYDSALERYARSLYSEALSVFSSQLARALGQRRVWTARFGRSQDACLCCSCATIIRGESL